MTANVDAAGSGAPQNFLRRVTLSQWIVVSLVVGVALGLMFPTSDRELHGWAASDLAILSNVFLRMIKMLIVPLLFATLVVGIAGHGDDMKKVGRLAFRSIVYFEVVTTAALAVGLIMVNMVKPGQGISLTGAPTDAAKQFAATKMTFSGVVEHTVPTSFFDAASRNEVLQVVFFAIIFGVALSKVTGENKSFMLRFAESLSDVRFKFVG
ncbi:MAG TPA: cation:dicarboxylase symporter family transporter, partial [Gemmatimonadaceae bacterium]